MKINQKNPPNGFNKDIFNFKKNIKEIWNGEPSLAYSFWVIYVVYTTILGAIGYFWGERADTFSTFEDFIYIFYIIFVYIFFLIASVGTWKSASKYKNYKKQNNFSSFWGILTQIIIILFIIRAIVILFKLAKDF